MQCDALILDEDSISDTYPYMEVGARDAVIGHEATVSKVADEQLFYLMSRGLSQEQAMGMIVNGFIEPVTRTLPDGVRRRVEPPDRAPDGRHRRLTLTPRARWQNVRCRCARTASTSRAAPTRTARPSGSATSTSRPRHRGAARTTARSSQRRLADVNWSHGTLVTPPTPDEPLDALDRDDGSVAAVLDEAEDILNSIGAQVLAEVAGRAGPARAAQLKRLFRRKR